LKSSESWLAVQYPDRLTCATAAPWNPEKGSIGGSCTVTGSLDGYVRLFFNRAKDDNHSNAFKWLTSRHNSNQGVEQPELAST
jgi:hypothetical protein